MTAERWQKVEELFEAALARPLGERTAFLAAACGGDEPLRQEVNALLLADREDEGAFEEIASKVATGWAHESARGELVGKTVGRYRILSLLGSGGMGEVYLADDMTLDRKAAIKLLPRNVTLDRERLRRFEQEARAASALNHPNIITIYEIGQADGTPFIASEYIEGTTLRDRMMTMDCGASDVLEIGMQASSALAAAHSAGIVHRDIKPANIMVRSDGYVKLVDFGLAKLTTSTPTNADVTAVGRVMGTINYMSPEQALGQPLDHRTDIFSLGVVLYELATGHRLFQAESEAATYNRILNHAPPPMREFNAQVPEELDQVIRRALEKDRDRRYQSSVDLRTDLKRLAQGNETTEAAKVALSARRTAHRKRNWRIGAIAALLLAISAALFFAGRLATRPRNVVPPPAEPSTKSIAVLPFDSLGSDKDSDYFADAVQDQILTDLAKVAELKVISRTSVMQYKSGAARNLREIGRQLGVANVLEGSVQRRGNRVRMNAQLIDTRDDTHLWAQTYDRNLEDVFAIQSEIAQTIADQLRARISPEEHAVMTQPPTKDVLAFRFYQRARELKFHNADPSAENRLVEAVDLLRQATQRDPAFLQAWCLLAEVELDLYWERIDHTDARLESSRAAVEEAVRLQPDAGETHLTQGIYYYHGLSDYSRALQELALAGRTLPNSADVPFYSAAIFRRQDRWDEALREFNRAAELDPRNFGILSETAHTEEAMEHYAEATRRYNQALAVSPGDVYTRERLAMIPYIERADPKPLQELNAAILATEPAAEEATAYYRLYAALAGRDLAGAKRALAGFSPRGYHLNEFYVPPEWYAGLTARTFGDEAGARAAFLAAREKVEQVVSEHPDYATAWSMLGWIDAALGRNEQAVREGQHACELIPASKDAYASPNFVGNLAMIYAWIGEKDLAVQTLAQVAHAKLGLLSTTRYGSLKLDPQWDPLRGDPRFEQLVADLAPKQSK
jgi:serine/threonine protein kinase/Flp pilus assembly protein TadD